MTPRNAIACALALVSLPVALRAQPEMPPAQVRVAEVVRHQLAPTTLVPGTVFSRDDARVSAEVAGVLEWVAEVGTTVQEDEEVARIDDTQLQLQLAEAEGRVTRESARVRFLERETARLRDLAKRDLVSDTQVEQVESDYDVARGDLTVARAVLAQIKDQIERTTLEAPFGGIVVARVQREGERVSVGDAVVRMLDPQAREVVARAPLEYLQFVRPGEEIRVQTASGTFSGPLRSVVAVGEERSHLFELRIDVSHTDLAVGQTVRVAVPMANAREVLAVPRDALVLRREGTAVFVVEDGETRTAKRVPVEIGVGDGPLIEVSGALEPGQTVVVRGNERLQPGQPVMILEG